MKKLFLFILWSNEVGHYLCSILGMVMSKRFVSEAIEPIGGFDPETMSRGEPALPRGFRWRETDVLVGKLRSTKRGLKEDRGDIYLKRHYYEFETTDGRIAVVYFERQARAGAPRWWLYTLEDPA